jgi:hypothetical protein
MPDEVDAALLAFVERQLARKRLSAKTGKSEDELLAEETQAGKRRVLAQAARIRRNGRRFAAQSAMVARTRARASTPRRQPSRQGTSREHRSTVRRAGGAVRSRDRPRQSDDEEPADHVVRLRLTPELRAFLKAEVDRLVRQGIADQQVVDRALFRAVEAWGEAGVVA